MVQKKLYRYLGRNGIITSSVLLDKIEHIPMLKLIADEGMLLTDGKQKVKRIDIFEEELSNWKEIADENK